MFMETDRESDVEAMSAMSAYPAQVVPGSTGYYTRHIEHYVTDEQYQYQNTQSHHFASRRQLDSEHSTVLVKPDPDDVQYCPVDRRRADPDDTRYKMVLTDGEQMSSFDANETQRIFSDRYYRSAASEAQWRRSQLTPNDGGADLRRRGTPRGVDATGQPVNLTSTTAAGPGPGEQSIESRIRGMVATNDDWNDVVANAWRQTQGRREMTGSDEDEAAYNKAMEQSAELRRMRCLEQLADARQQQQQQRQMGGAAVDDDLYQPRALFVDHRRRADKDDEDTAPFDWLQHAAGGADRSKAKSDYDGSPPAPRLGGHPGVDEDFLNERRPTWPLGAPLRRRLLPTESAISSTSSVLDQIAGRRLPTGVDGKIQDDDDDKKSPIDRLIRRYDPAYPGSQRSADVDQIGGGGQSPTSRMNLSSIWRSQFAGSKGATAGHAPAAETATSDCGDAKKTYSCHICPYIGDQKHDFDEHMRLHFDHWCPYCDYSSRTEGRLRCHIKMFHAANVELDANAASGGAGSNGGSGAAKTQDAGAAAAAAAGKRKPKFITCQKCGFKAKEKEELWLHRRQKHMSADKVLECPRCPFATELRHHLEYHLRSHYGSRPYKCDKCTYRCYNQSMLNSHAKSHTNVYQFRCADCQFAAKYCHSLKVHLRQNPTHKAAPVLNEDGSIPTDGSGDFDVISRRGRPRGPRGGQRPAPRAPKGSGARSRQPLDPSIFAAASDAGQMSFDGDFSEDSEPLPPPGSQSLAMFAQSNKDAAPYKQPLVDPGVLMGGGFVDAAAAGAGPSGQGAGMMALSQLGDFVDNVVSCPLESGQMGSAVQWSTAGMARRPGPAGNENSPPLPVLQREAFRSDSPSMSAAYHGSPMAYGNGRCGYPTSVGVRRMADFRSAYSGSPAISPAAVLGSAEMYGDYEASVPNPDVEPERAQCGDLPLDLTAKARPGEAVDRPVTVDPMDGVRSGQSPLNDDVDQWNADDEAQIFRKRRNFRNWSRAQAFRQQDLTSVGSPSGAVGERPPSGGVDAASPYATAGTPAAAGGSDSAGSSPRPSSVNVDDVEVSRRAEKRRTPTEKSKTPPVAASPSNAPAADEEQPVEGKRRRRSDGGTSWASDDERDERRSPASSGQASPVSGRYQCVHCEIDFHGSRVLHAMHMAYHGPVDPFQCSSCGQKTPDRVAFFLHLARVAHN